MLRRVAIMAVPACISALAWSQSAPQPVFTENFNRNKSAPWWSPQDTQPSLDLKVKNKRLEFSTKADAGLAAQSMVSMKADNWLLLTDRDFRASVRFRFVPQPRASASAESALVFLLSPQDAESFPDGTSEGVLVRMGQTLPEDAPTATWREFAVSRIAEDGTQSELARWTAAANDFSADGQFAFSAPLTSKLFLRYAYETDTLFVSFVGFDDPAATAIEALTGGLHTARAISLGGIAASPKALLGKNAWFDDLRLDEGMILTAPMGVTASDDLHAKVQVNWRAATGAAFYTVIRTETDGESPTEMDLWVDQEARRFEDVQVELGRPFLYRVRAYASDGSFLDSADAVSGSAVLLPPQGLQKLDMGYGSATLTWDDASPERWDLQYELYRRSGNGPAELVDYSQSNVAYGYLDEDLVVYSFFVRVYDPNSGLRSAPSAAVTAFSAPSVLVYAEDFPNKVRVAWEPAGGHTIGFLVYRRFEGGTFRQIASVGGSVHSFNDTSIPAGECAEYLVRARYDIGNGPLDESMPAMGCRW